MNKTFLTFPNRLAIVLLFANHYGICTETSAKIEEGWRYRTKFEVMQKGTDKQTYCHNHAQQHQSMHKMHADITSTKEKLSDKQPSAMRNSRSARVGVTTRAEEKPEIQPEKKNTETKLAYHCIARFSAYVKDPVGSYKTIVMPLTAALLDTDFLQKPFAAHPELVFVSSELPGNPVADKYVIKTDADQYKLQFFPWYPNHLRPFQLTSVTASLQNQETVIERIKNRFCLIPDQSFLKTSESYYSQTHGSIVITRKKLFDVMKTALSAYFNHRKPKDQDTRIEKILTDADLLASGSANSYNCAEQGWLMFLAISVVKQNLQSTLYINSDDFIYGTVDLHCCHTPCGCCAPSIARELEPDGLIAAIFNGKPFHLLCSAAERYERKPGATGYNQLTGLYSEIPTPEKPIPETPNARLPYGVLQLNENGEIDVQKIRLMMPSQELDMLQEIT